MDFNEFKTNWQTAKIDVTDSETAPRQVFDMLRKSKSKTSVDRLAQYYKRFCFMAAAMLIMSFWLYRQLFSELPVAPWQQWLTTALWVLLMAIAGSVDGYLYHRLSNMNLSQMTVVEVAAQAGRCRRIHLLSQLVLAPIAIAFICTMVMNVRTDEPMLLGVCLGGVFGLCIGLRIWLRMMRLYKLLIADSHDLLE